MPTDEKETWGEYGKLVLKELERLDSRLETLIEEIDERFKEVDKSLHGFTNTERLAQETKDWVKEVHEVWSPTQMKESKNEIYQQKNKWVATIAILTFVEVLVGLFIAWASTKH